MLWLRLDGVPLRAQSGWHAGVGDHSQLRGLAVCVALSRGGVPVPGKSDLMVVVRMAGVSPRTVRRLA